MKDNSLNRLKLKPGFLGLTYRKVQKYIVFRYSWIQGLKKAPMIWSFSHIFLLMLTLFGDSRNCSLMLSIQPGIPSKIGLFYPNISKTKQANKNSH